jgi:serine phosphatase RsbU (regulator of sigma subunit)
MVIIGKSTANNISGALFFDRLKIMIRCLTQSNLSPSELLNKLSYNLNFDSTCDTFATVSVLLLSKDGKMATICCAGSPHPIVVRSRSGFLREFFL